MPHNANLHLMITYELNGEEVTRVCDCWFGKSHLGPARRGEVVIGAAIAAGDLAAVPGHQSWSVAGGCECGLSCPTIEYWRAHVKAL